MHTSRWRPASCGLTYEYNAEPCGTTIEKKTKLFASGRSVEKERAIKYLNFKYAHVPELVCRPKTACGGSSRCAREAACTYSRGRATERRRPSSVLSRWRLLFCAIAEVLPNDLNQSPPSPKRFPLPATPPSAGPERIVFINILTRVPISIIPTSRDARQCVVVSMGILELTFTYVFFARRFWYPSTVQCLYKCHSSTSTHRRCRGVPKPVYWGWRTCFNRIEFHEMFQSSVLTY